MQVDIEDTWEKRRNADRRKANRPQGCTYKTMLNILLKFNC